MDQMAIHLMHGSRNVSVVTSNLEDEMMAQAKLSIGCGYESGLHRRLSSQAYIP